MTFTRERIPHVHLGQARVDIGQEPAVDDIENMPTISVDGARSDVLSRCLLRVAVTSVGMRLAGAFFANRAEVVNDMLNVEGGFWSSTVVSANATSFQCNCVVLCDTRRRDVGTHYALHVDAAGPTGARWASAFSRTFQLPSAMKFMVLTQIALPIEPNGGRHVYSFRMEGSHERFDVPLDVIVK